MKNIHRSFLLALMLLVLALPARAQDDEAMNSQDMQVIGHGTVKAILKSDMIELDDDTRYRLENILIPPYEDQPAVDELKKEFLGKKVTAYAFQQPSEDDTNSTLPYAHIVTTKGDWVQQDLISKGLAWVYCSATSPQTVPILKQAEEKARVDQDGFWKDPAYAIKTPQEAGQYIDSYQIIEGQISAVGMRSGSNFIDFIFGRGRKRDFTIRFENTDAFQSFLDNPVTGNKDKDGFNQWKGRTVRVRGWIRNDHGPAIVLTRKEQLDILNLHAQ